jgi:hypothetical protein
MNAAIQTIHEHYAKYNAARVDCLQSRATKLERYAGLLANGSRPSACLERELASRQLNNEQRALAVEDLVQAVRNRNNWYDDHKFSEWSEHQVLQAVDLALIVLLHGPQRMCIDCMRHRDPWKALPAWAGPYCHDHFEPAAHLGGAE